MIGNDWDNVLSVIWSSQGFHNFFKIVENEYATKTIFPTKENIFNALKNTPYGNVKVVIVGQDPYFNMGEAHGLSFSVQKGIRIPPSLRNIFKELEDDLGFTAPDNGDLTSWTKEGVLLLNSVLTVEKGKAASHQKLGWQNFTDYVIKKINEKNTPVVFILWGNYARSKKVFVTNPKHLVLESVHPSPFAVYNGFFGSKPFSKTNDFLIKNNVKPINWNLKS